MTYAGGDSDDISIYLDGELQSASTLVGSPKRLNTGTGPAAIGRSVNGKNHYAGLIDDVRLYDVALSAEQVLALFEEHSQTPLAEDNQDEPEPSEQSIEADDEEADDGAVDLPDPVAHWSFDNDAVDGAGSSHGTVSGGAASRPTKRVKASVATRCLLTEATTTWIWTCTCLTSRLGIQQEASVDGSRLILAVRVRLSSATARMWPGSVSP